MLRLEQLLVCAVIGGVIGVVAGLLACEGIYWLLVGRREARKAREAKKARDAMQKALDRSADKIVRQILSGVEPGADLRILKTVSPAAYDAVVARWRQQQSDAASKKDK